MNRQGFTLLEVLIALVILAIGVLGTAKMEITSVRGNFFSRYLTQGSIVAQDRLEYLDNSPYSSPQLAAGSYSDTTTTISGIVFTGQYTVVANAGYKIINYTVTWNDGSNRNILISTIRSQ